MIAHGIVASGGTTPRSAVMTVIREQYKLRKRWRLNRTRQYGESPEGEGALTLAKDTGDGGGGSLPILDQGGQLSATVPQ